MNINTETQRKKRSLEAFKWITIIILLLMAIIGNYLYRDVVLLRRAPVVIALIAMAGGISLLTTKGRAMTVFALEAYAEIRKVIWPTYQETLNTTLIIALVTAIMSLVLWGLDCVLVRLISFVASLRF